MKSIGNILLVLSAVFGLLGARSLWRDFQYEKASMAVKAEVLSVEVINIKSTVAKIVYSLAFQRDGYVDTLEHITHEIHTTKNPLPTVEALKTTAKFVRYVPQNNRRMTILTERVDITDSPEYVSSHKWSYFTYMLAFFVFRYLIKK
ncbi:MAG: hypothetical protein IT270_03625 [Saprospiraceae bacterium]|nr:hypothetical protein [Saprospiraceae bacterium]